MKKIGIMGGTFNPIHNGHLRMAQAAYEQYGLDEVWFMPSGNPPHKNKSDIVSGEHRERMVKSALDGIPYFSFSDMELRRQGTTYTSETLQEIHREHPRHEIYFILGSDSLADLDQWHEPEVILKHCTILSAPRGDMAAEDMAGMCREKGKKFGGKILPVRMEYVQISSENIRRRLAEGKSVLTICPEKTACYIRLHGLYGCPTLTLHATEKNRAEIINCLSATLRPKRYLHTLGVMETAAALGFCHLDGQADIRRAELAGLLHDCAKYFTGDEMIGLCGKYDIELTETERANTALIHGKLGAFYARERYGVNDEEILSAIRYHTTGRPDMTTLEKIIYVADYIEPGRQMHSLPYGLPEIRRECFRDLDKGLFMILSNVINYLQDSKNEIDEMSIRTYEYYGGENKHGKESRKHCKDRL